MKEVMQKFFEVCIILGVVWIGLNAGGCRTARAFVDDTQDVGQAFFKSEPQPQIYK